MSTAPRRRVVAFDVDGTLTRRDCVVPFLRQQVGAPAMMVHLLGRPVELVGAVRRRDRDALKEMAVARLRGLDHDDLRADGARFARHVFDGWLRDEVVSKLEAHRASGDTVVLVSASFELYLLPLGELLGADAALGTRVELDPLGRLSGRLDGANCRGPEKVRRLHEWLEREAGGRAAVELVAYGDSAGDVELLADADEAHWVGRFRPTRVVTP